MNRLQMGPHADDGEYGEKLDGSVTDHVNRDAVDATNARTDRGGDDV